MSVDKIQVLLTVVVGECDVCKRSLAYPQQKAFVNLLQKRAYDTQSALQAVTMIPK